MRLSHVRKSAPSSGPSVPDKLYFRIGEVARLLGVETHTLRFWEGEFPQLKVGKGGTGQRLYRRRDVELLLEIKHLLYDRGYTIPGARQMLQDHTRQAEDRGGGRSSEQRQGSLARLRSDLRTLSDMLQAPPGVSSQRTAAESGKPGVTGGTRLLAVPHRGSRGAREAHLQSHPLLFDGAEGGSAD